MDSLLARTSSRVYSCCPIRGRFRATFPYVVWTPTKRSQKCPVTFVGCSSVMVMLSAMSSISGRDSSFAEVEIAEKTSRGLLSK